MPGCRRTSPRPTTSGAVPPQQQPPSPPIPHPPRVASDRRLTRSGPRAVALTTCAGGRRELLCIQGAGVGEGRVAAQGTGISEALVAISIPSLIPFSDFLLNVHSPPESILFGHPEPIVDRAFLPFFAHTDLALSSGGTGFRPALGFRSALRCRTRISGAPPPRWGFPTPAGGRAFAKLRVASSGRGPVPAQRQGKGPALGSVMPPTDLYRVHPTTPSYSKFLMSSFFLAVCQNTAIMCRPQWPWRHIHGGRSVDLG